MTDKENKIILESAVRLSESKLWAYQEAYFDEHGIAAWLGPVPYYVSSNAVICHSYANVVCRYLQDSYRVGVFDLDHPIYLLEMGTGCGQFSYQFLCCLDELLNQLGLSFLPVCYLMSDFTEKNIDFWQEHHQLAPFVERGMLDFCVYDAHRSQSLTLIHARETLVTSSVANPMLLIANYLFDTIKHDVFRVREGELQEGRCSLSTSMNNADVNGRVLDLEQLDAAFEFSPIDGDYYQNPMLNNVLKFYKDSLNESTFLVPIGAIDSIDFFRSLCDDRLFLISGDKSYTTLQALEGLGLPHIAFHGGFSLMVNYHAIEAYVKSLGGDALMGSNTEGFKISAFSLGHSLSSYHETQVAYAEFIHHFSTKEFLPLKNNLINRADNMKSADLMGLLKLSRWDPKVILQLNDRLIDILPTASNAYRLECGLGLLRTYRHYYFMPNNHNLFYILGYLHLLLGDIDIAIDRFLQATQFFSPDALTYVHLALCYYKNHQYQDAVGFAHKALELDSELTLAKEILQAIPS